MIIYPKELVVKASSLDPALFDRLTDGERFNFQLSYVNAPDQLFTAKAAQADEPGIGSNLRYSARRPRHLANLQPQEPRP